MKHYNAFVHSGTLQHGDINLGIQVPLTSYLWISTLIW